ncbi:MAG: DUF6644 family protein [Pseudohongiellaceae bacterium]
MAIADQLASLLADSPMRDASLYMLRNIPGFPPIIQTIHILAIAVVMGSIVMIDLRMLGLAVRSQQISEMIRRLMPWFWTALVTLAISGSFFVFARPARYFNNPVFIWKFTFLLPALILALVLHLLSRREVDFWGRSGSRLLTGRLIALTSLGLWIMVAMAGRWIAYSEYLYYPA